MSNDGPSTVRWALGVIVDTVMLCDSNIKAYYNHVKERTGSESYAHVLTMEKLARMLHHIMIAEETWRRKNADLTEEKLSRLDRAGGDST